MQVEVTINGEAVPVSLDVTDLTLRETVDIRRHLGEEYASTLGVGNVFDPLVLQAIIWVRLRGRFPDVTPDDFDIPMSALFGALDANPTTGS